MPYGVGYPFVHLGSAVLGVSPPGFLLPIPCLLARGVVWEAEKPLMLGEHCSAISIGVLPTLLVTKPKHSTKQATMKQSSSIPVKTGTAFYASVTSLPLCATGQKSGNRKPPFLHVNLQSLCLEEDWHLFTRLFPTSYAFIQDNYYFLLYLKGKKFSPRMTASQAGFYWQF